MNQTFDAFVRQKRMAQGISLRGLAARLDLSPVYMSSIEADRKPAPVQEKLDKLAEEIAYLEEPHLSHRLVGVMAKNTAGASKPHV